MVLFVDTSSSAVWMHGSVRRFFSNLSDIAYLTCGPRYCKSLAGEAGSQALNILHIRRRESFSFSTVSNTLPDDLFRMRYSRLRWLLLRRYPSRSVSKGARTSVRR